MRRTKKWSLIISKLVSAAEKFGTTPSFSVEVMNEMLAGDSLVERPDVLEYVILPLLDVKEMQDVFARINADEDSTPREMFGLLNDMIVATEDKKRTKIIAGIASVVSIGVLAVFLSALQAAQSSQCNSRKSKAKGGKTVK